MVYNEIEKRMGIQCDPVFRRQTLELRFVIVLAGVLVVDRELIDEDTAVLTAGQAVLLNKPVEFFI